MPQHRKTHLISADGVMCFTGGFSIAGLTRSLRMGFLLGSVIVGTSSIYHTFWRRYATLTLNNDRFAAWVTPVGVTLGRRECGRLHRNMAVQSRAHAFIKDPIDLTRPSIDIKTWLLRDAPGWRLSTPTGSVAH